MEAPPKEKLQGTLKYGVETRVEGDRLFARLVPGCKYLIREEGASRTFRSCQSKGTRWVDVASVADDIWHIWGYSEKQCRYELTIKKGPRGYLVLHCPRESQISKAGDGEGCGSIRGGKKLATHALRTILAEWRDEFDTFFVCEQI